MADLPRKADNTFIMFAVGAFLGALACFSRADYNLPFFAFMCVMWDQDDVSTIWRKLTTNLERERTHPPTLDHHDSRRRPLAAFLDPILPSARDFKV